MAEGNFRVLIVDDHEIVHLGLKSLVQNLEGYSICGACFIAATAPGLAAELRPDIVVMDMMLGPTQDGIGLIRETRAAAEKAHILVYTMLDELRYARRSLQAGALGYVMKSAGADALGVALQAVARGECHISFQVQQSLLHDIVNSSGRLCHSEEDLSDGEMRVFRKLGAGLGSAQIAKELEISQKTVSSYRERIKNKLGLHTARELESRAEGYLHREKFPNAS